jgi:hypothetical protein
VTAEAPAVESSPVPDAGPSLSRHFQPPTAGKTECSIAGDTAGAGDSEGEMGVSVFAVSSVSEKPRRLQESTDQH